MIMVETNMRMRMKSRMIIMMTLSNLFLISATWLRSRSVLPWKKKPARLSRRFNASLLSSLSSPTSPNHHHFPWLYHWQRHCDQVEVNLVPEEVCRLESKESCNQVPKETCVDIQVVKKQLTKVSKKLSKGVYGRCRSVKRWTRIFATRSPGQCASWSRGWGPMRLLRRCSSLGTLHHIEKLHHQ